MSTSPESSARLARLEAILAQSPSVTRGGSDTDPAQAHLTSVPLERIQALTREVHERTASATAPDGVDAITIRLLLNDYKAAVAHLRAVANGVHARLHTAAAQLNKSRKLLRREEEMAAKRAAARDDTRAGQPRE